MAPMLLDLAIKGVLILALGAAAALLLRRGSAAARHLAWTLAFVGLCLLPPLAVIGPRWRAAVLPLAASAAVEPSPALNPAPSDPFTAEIDPARLALGGAGGPQTARATGDAGGPSRIVLLWAGGVLIVAAQLLFRLIAAGFRNWSAAVVSDGAWAMLLDEVTGEYGIRRPVSLRIAAGSTIPATWGFWRPVVLLPVEALDWPRDRLRAVLLHELAHVARRDFLAQTLARLACALHWFNPFAWLAERRLRAECEQATDDLVLASGLGPADYATHLVEVLKAAQKDKTVPAGALAMARWNGFEDRVRAILDGERPRSRITPRRLVLMTLVATAFLLPMALMRFEARAHDAPKLERLPSGMTIEVVGISPYPSGASTWWGPNGTPLARPPCDPVAEALGLHGKDLKEIVARITGLPEGTSVTWHPTQSESHGTAAPQKDGRAAPELHRVVARFRADPAVCDLHFDVAVGPWKSERVFDGKRSMGITEGERAFFLGTARETHQQTALALAHNITDRVVRIVAIDEKGREHHPISDDQGGAGHFSGMDVVFDLPPGQIREFQLQSRQVGRFEIKNVALRPRQAGP
jgi:beta-lactamase regulating signal transducer with metallopeptidase domain